MIVDKNDIFKEIDLIQACILRMANNSFSIKGWHIGIISALMAFFFSKDDVNYNLIAITIAVVTIVFWYLDSYYLMMERKYRWKYQWVLKERINSDIINKSYFFDLNPDNSEMWETNVNSKTYKAALKTIECRNNMKSSVVCTFYHLREIELVMASNTMQAQYMLIFSFTIIAEIIYLLIR